MKKSLLILGAVLLQVSICNCQINPKESDDLRGPYLGQTPPENQSKIFAQGFISIEFGELNSVFTKDGKELHSDVENFGYIIDAGGFSLFHSGDGSFSDKLHFESYHFGERDFDMVFLDRTFLRKEGQEIMNSLIHTKDLVFMHIEPGKSEYYKSIIKEVPGLSVFTKKIEKKQLI